MREGVGVGVGLGVGVGVGAGVGLGIGLGLEGGTHMGVGTESRNSRVGTGEKNGAKQSWGLVLQNSVDDTKN
jgi:hypothetical protein